MIKCSHGAHAVAIGFLHYADVINQTWTQKRKLLFMQVLFNTSANRLCDKSAFALL